jgi:predicted dehydrogenase
MIKLGMLGMWHTHADGLVRQVLAQPDVYTLAGFYDPDPEVVGQRTRQWQEKVRGFRVHSSPKELLKQPLDAVVVEGRVFENVSFARMALESGRPVLLEKPAGDNWDDFRQLADLAQRKHLHVQMLYIFRYMSAVQEMLRRARGGEAGAVYEFRARLPKPLAEYHKAVDELRPYKGGMFFEMAGHVIDMMVSILGKPKSVTPFLGHHHTEPPVEYMDNGVAVFGFERAWGIIEVPALEVVPQTRRLEVYGTEGALVIPHLGSGHLTNKDTQPLEICRAGGDWRTLDLPAQALHVRDLTEFAAVLTGKKAPEYSLEHDLIVHEALLKASGMW